jgi:hypothetical protein
LSDNENSGLVSAQTKTIHAVRSIAVYILYSAVFTVIGGAIIGISAAVAANSYDGPSSGTGGIIFGIVIIGIGNLVGLISGLSELGKSNPAYLGVSQPGPMVSGAVSKSAGCKLVPCQHCGTPNGWNSERCTNCDGLIE